MIAPMMAMMNTPPKIALDVVDFVQVTVAATEWERGFIGEA
jgi:hypothetical protein